MLVLSSPSGAGKTTLSRQLLENDSQIQLSVSCTTRAEAAGRAGRRGLPFRRDGDFRGMIEREQFLEHAQVFGNSTAPPRAGRGR